MILGTSQNRALQELRQQGWTIVPSDVPELLTRVVAAVTGIARGIAGSARETELRELVGCFSASELNHFVQNVNKSVGQDSRMLLDPFKSLVRSICGTEILYQRRPYLRANVPSFPQWATEPHSDVFHGHSPHAFTIWIPLHDVDGDNGIYLFDRAESREIHDAYQSDEPLGVALSNRHPQQPRPRFGEAIVFCSYLIHGARANVGKLPRVSLDMRFQPARAPLFEKAADLYGLARL